MKIIGSILIISAASLLGMRAAADMDMAYSEMKYIRQMLYMLQSEIHYSRAYLSEAFRNLEKTARNPYDVWLRQLYLRMERRSAGSFEKIWKDTIEEYLSDLKLPKRQKHQLIELGTYLGNADAEMQIKHIGLLEEQLEIGMKEMREELGNKKRLCRCLGVMSGIFLSILFI